MKNLIISCFMIILLSCSVAQFKSVVRTIRDVAHVICCLEESKSGAVPDGMSVEAYCDMAEVIDPYVQEITAAGKAAAGRVSASREPQ